MTITDFIKTHFLKAGDALELICPVAGFPKHYAIFLGMKNNIPRFIANTADGIIIISNKKLLEFTQKYEVSAIERFKGTLRQRQMAVRRAVSRVGEKAYNIVFNNCEHFKNWVLNGESTSKQVKIIGSFILTGGVALFVTGLISEKKGVQKLGIIILLILLAVIVVATVMARRDENSI